jgi:hypothetical protein
LWSRGPSLRSQRPDTAQPRPFRALGRPRLDASPCTPAAGRWTGGSRMWRSRGVRPARQVRGRRRGDGVLTRIGGWMVPSCPRIEACPSGSTGTASCRLPTALWQESLTVRRGGRKASMWLTLAAPHGIAAGLWGLELEPAPRVPQPMGHAPLDLLHWPQPTPSQACHDGEFVTGHRWRRRPRPSGRACHSFASFCCRSHVTTSNPFSAAQRRFASHHRRRATSS